jgi:hypothetical protein
VTPEKDSLAVAGLIQLAGLAATQYFGSLDGYRRSRVRPDSFEIMIQPAHASDGTLMAEPQGEPLENALRELDLLERGQSG